MSIIIEFPKKVSYQGACSDCGEVIIRRKDLDYLNKIEEEFIDLKRMSLWDRIFNWPY